MNRSDNKTMSNDAIDDRRKKLRMIRNFVRQERNQSHYVTPCNGRANALGKRTNAMRLVYPQVNVAGEITRNAGLHGMRRSGQTGAGELLLMTQQSCGNQYVQRLVEPLGHAQLQRRIPTSIRERLQPGNQRPIVQRRTKRGSSRPIRGRYDSSKATSIILSQLRRFRQISITVSGKTVKVRAAFFINAGKIKRYHTRRRSRYFRAVIRALRGRSFVQGYPRRTVGEAIEKGKATSGEIKQFVEKALRRGEIQRFARRSRLLTSGQKLAALSSDLIRRIIQKWIWATGVGVDCSGFVQQALIKLRKKLGYRPFYSRGDYYAAKFGRTGRNVRRPQDLRPGDVWVTPGGDHIRIISAVRSKMVNGRDRIEFDTAESSAALEHRNVREGPIGKTWLTRSKTVFGWRLRGKYRRFLY